jgi:hypothetical protein
MTANISSGGLLMTCDKQFRKGTLVTVRLQWPVGRRKDNLFLVVQGEIIRREPARIAIRQRRHDFELA